MRKYIISFKELNKKITVNDLVRNIITHEIFVVTKIEDSIVIGSTFGDTNINDLCAISIGIKPLNKYSAIEEINTIEYNPFIKFKNRLLKKQWEVENLYCDNNFIPFNSHEVELEMLSKLNTIIPSDSTYFFNTFKYMLP